MLGIYFWCEVLEGAVDGIGEERTRGAGEEGQDLS
jgi:hypothetical protein